jgi:CBS domain-containing protein
MKTVRQILDNKGHDVWCVNVNAPVIDAIKLMEEKRVGALVVTHDDKPVGIISERDYARKVILKGRSSHETRIGEIMTRRVLYVQPGQTVEECMALMTEKSVRHLPVLDKGALVGMLSIGDLVRAIIADQQLMIELLERYIETETGRFFR